MNNSMNGDIETNANDSSVLSGLQHPLYPPPSQK